MPAPQSLTIFCPFRIKANQWRLLHNSHLRPSHPRRVPAIQIAVQAAQLHGEQNKKNQMKQRSTPGSLSFLVLAPKDISIKYAKNVFVSSDATVRSPAPSINIFGTRSRRYSTSFSPLANGVLPRLTPRVSQLRQEECADISNSREVTHEREVHTALQISQSWEDLTIDADNLSVKSETELTFPLHVTTAISALPGILQCSSPSPTRFV